jgi:hypothetical protein
LDLWTATGLEEVLRRIVAAVPWGWGWRERLQGLWLGLGLNLGVRADASGNPTFTLAGAPGEIPVPRARELFVQLLGRLDAVAGEAGHPVALIMDEFQRLEEMEAGSAPLLRSAIQESRALAWVCAGSTTRLVDALVGPAGPLHGIFDELTVGPIDEDLLARWIEDRMRSHGVRPTSGTGAEIVARAGPVTEDILRLAGVVFDAGAVRGAVDVTEVPAAMHRIVLDRRAGYERLWVELAQSQRNVLRAVASGEPRLTSRDTIRRFGLPTPAGVLKAQERLRSRHLLHASGDALADPFLREWILLAAMPDGVSRSELPAD